MFSTAAGRSRRGTHICLFLTRWPLLLLLIIIFLQLASCHKSTDPPKYCSPSSCGNIQNISYPFRLDSDPPNCGSSDNDFTLFCDNNSSLFLYPNNNSARFLIKGISYNNFTIHLVDPVLIQQQSNCSSDLPALSPISYYGGLYGTYPFSPAIRKASASTVLSQTVVFVSCEKQALLNQKSSSIINYVEITTATTAAAASSYCSLQNSKTKKKYSYVIVSSNYDVSFRDLMESCTVDMKTLTSVNWAIATTSTYLDIHTQLSYGFHLSWYRVFCPEYCREQHGYECLIDQSNRPICDYTFRLLIYNIGVVLNMLGWSDLILILQILVMFHGPVMLLGTPCVFAFLIYKWRRRHLSSYNSVEEFLQNHTNLIPIRYSYKNIKKITTCFKDKLGEGGFGCVYKGKLRSGNFAAIKILGKSSKGTDGQDFINEVATIGRIHHVNVVQLVGYCAERSKRALVYDFMSNGSLDKYIFPKQGFVSLSWEKLFEISLGVARGIEYLHRGCYMQILHFDIKPHNILLDENFIPKVSDFGLAKLYPSTKDTIASLTAPRGTSGYMAPELFYKNIGRVSYKADVYSFGMLLLEIAGKRKNLNPLVENFSQIYFPSWVYDQVSNGDNIEIGDNVREEETKLVKKMIIVGLWCIQMKPENRPSMNKVLEMLEGDMESLEMPPKPELCP